VVARTRARLERSSSLESLPVLVKFLGGTLETLFIEAFGGGALVVLDEVRTDLGLGLALEEVAVAESPGRVSPIGLLR